MKSFNIAAAFALAGALVLTSAHAQQPQGQDPHQTMPQRGTMTEPKSGMMDVDKMMAEMKASDARLEAMSAKMESTKGPEKVLAMQDVVSELVKNQVDMHRHMAMMHEGMMSQMPHK
jgi:hypothetical protein